MTWNKKIKQEARKNRFKAWLILSLGIFLSLSFYSYNPQDPSLNSFGLSLKITNYCGFVGASLADLFYQVFGLSSWFFIFIALWLSYKFFTNTFRESLISSFLLFGLFLISFSGLSELHFPTILFFKDSISLGGALGEILVSGLKPLFHFTGTAVLLWSAFLLVFIFYGLPLFPFFSFFSLRKKLLFLFNIFKKTPAGFLFVFLKLKETLLLFMVFPKKIFWFFIKSSSLLKIKTNFLIKKEPSQKKSLKALIKEKSLFLNKTLSSQNPAQNSDSLKEKSLFSNTQKPAQNSDSLKEKSLFPNTQKPAQNSDSLKEKSLFSNTQKPAQNSDSLKEKSLFSNTQKPAQNSDSLKENKILNLSSQETKDSSIQKKSFISSQLPSLDILSKTPPSSKNISRQDVEELSKKLLDKLAQFSIQGQITAIKTGPAVILFEFKPEDHVKVSRIREMESDLSLALSSESIRIIAPIPGRDVVGIEASRPYREMVYLKNLLKEDRFLKAELPLVLGRRADNFIGIKDLARIPHLLVAGTTGSGKSIFIISFITSLLFRHTPETLRILLIDPKQVDLSAFKDIPHLLSPIITSTSKTVGALQWALIEMEKRYRSLALFEARDHKSFNEKVSRLNNKEKTQHEEINKEASLQELYYFEPLPLICIVIEEFGDLMADRTIKRSIENSVVRLAQKARASGIHLVLAMQSPRKDVITGLIKTNIPGRISFKVASGTDSRVILDENGAERLLSHGDMLFLEPGNPKPFRYHGPFVREKDIKELCNYWKSQGEPLYDEILTKEISKKYSMESSHPENLNIKEDPMYNEILEFVKSCNVVSASFLQRKFRIGYPRAARMIEVLFEEGRIGPPQGSKPREVLINK